MAVSSELKHDASLSSYVCFQSVWTKEFNKSMISHIYRFLPCHMSATAATNNVTSGTTEILKSYICNYLKYGN